MIIEALPRRPLILIGDGWQSVFDQMYRAFDGYIPPAQRELIQFAANARLAVEMLGRRVS